jgi:hypothetical protein
MEDAMLKGIVPVAILAMLMFGGSAGAVPLANLDGTASPHVTLVYGGCGAYAHCGPYGGCRPGGQFGGYWGGGISPCPYGYHLGPYGRHCWPN